MAVDTLTELMARDVFPAEVLMPDGKVLVGVRVFVTSHRAQVWQNRSGTLTTFDLARRGPGNAQCAHRRDPPLRREAAGTTGLAVRTATD